MEIRGNNPSLLSAFKNPNVRVSPTLTTERLQTPAQPVTMRMQSPRPLLPNMVADFGNVSETPTKQSAVQTVERVDLSKLMGHLTSEQLLFLVDYDPDTYNEDNTDLQPALETALTAGESRSTVVPLMGRLDESDFNNFVSKMPNRYDDTPRFAVTSNEDTRVKTVRIDDIQQLMKEILDKSDFEQILESAQKSRMEKESEEQLRAQKKVEEKVVYNSLTLQEPMTQEEMAMVKELQARDQEVRNHELAHQATGAGLTSGASFVYQMGPDGKRYAVGGEVSIQVGGGNSPEDSIQRSKRILAAATAPTNPSPADIQVAMRATQILAQAQMEVAQERTETETKVQQKSQDAQPLTADQSEGTLNPKPDINAFIRMDANLTQLAQAEKEDTIFREKLQELDPAYRSDPPKDSDQIQERKEKRNILFSQQEEQKSQFRDARLEQLVVEYPPEEKSFNQDIGTQRSAQADLLQKMQTDREPISNILDERIATETSNPVTLSDRKPHEIQASLLDKMQTISAQNEEIFKSQLVHEQLMDHRAQNREEVQEFATGLAPTSVDRKDAFEHLVKVQEQRGIQSAQVQNAQNAVVGLKGLSSDQVAGNSATEQLFTPKDSLRIAQDEKLLSIAAAPMSLNVQQDSEIRKSTEEIHQSNAGIGEDLVESPEKVLPISELYDIL